MGCHLHNVSLLFKFYYTELLLRVEGTADWKDYGSEIASLAQPQHMLRLDFRDEFHLEPSEECKFDYLEVRDGEHGYSPLLGRYCGHQFPPMLKSTSRSLWLRFYSDDNIEYSGFRAVYTSVPRLRECFTINVP